jgi:hypothetical protein
MGLDLNTALISDTFDGLIKTTDGNALTGSPLVLTDGRGNDSSLALSTAGNGVTITGTLTVGGVDIGGDLATAQSDITAIETKTDFITVTGAVNLDTIKTKADFITVTQAVDLDTIESDIASATAKTQYITVTQAVNLDTMESDILSAKTKTDFITIGQAVNLDNVESGLATAEADIIAIEAKTDYITISSALNLNTVASNASAAKTKTDFLTVTQAVNLDTLESDVNVAKGDITAIEAKTDNITVTQAVNLDTMESDLASSKAKTDFITITQAVNLDTVESGLSQAQTDINLIEAKTNNITVTQAVNLDTMESDIATNNAKNSYPAGDATKVGFISVTQAVNLDSMETDISNLSTNKYDKTGGTISGSVTITNDLTVNGTTTTVNTQTLSVKDPLIELANDNSANSVDTGFYANYSEDAGVTTKYAGLFKDAGDSDKFKLFKGLEVEPTTTVNTAGTGYTKGDLVVNDLDAVTISGTLSTAAQTNITSVGTLSSLAVSGDVSIGDKIIHLFDTDTSIGFPSVNTVSIETGGSERVRVTSTGNVGIGTSSPADKLDVAGNAIISGNLTVDTDTLVVKSFSNRVGIGTDSPLSTLDVVGDAKISGNLTVDTNTLFVDAANNRVGMGTVTPASGYRLDVNGDIKADQITCGSDSEASTIAILQSSTTGVSQLRMGDTDTDAGAITYDNTSDFMAFRANAAERMRIDASGNVSIASGILELAAQAKIIGSSDNLQISADPNNVSGASTIEFLVDGSERMRINSSGRVGIGTGSPNALLEVSSATGTAAGNPTVIRISTTTSAATWTPNADWGALQFYSPDTSDSGAKVHAQISANVTGASGGISDIVISQAVQATGVLTEKARFVNIGNYLKLAGGIQFNGDTAAANALDDYEEGTWTPVYVPSTGSFATMTMEVSTATYTKVGRMVTVFADIRTDDVDVTGGSGQVRIGGLPFTVVGNGGGITFGFVFGFVAPPDGGYFQQSSTQIRLRETGATTDLLVADLTDGTVADQNRLMFQGTYFV